MLRVDNRDNAYELGPRFSELTQLVRQFPLLSAASEVAMRRYADRTGETVSLGVLEDDEVRMLLRLGPDPEQDHDLVGLGRRPLYCTAIGKVLLAGQTEKTAKKILNRLSFEAITANTATSINSLKNELEATRRRGFGVDRNEIIEGVSCVAVPIRDSDGTTIAALSSSAPSFRMMPERVQLLSGLLSDASRSVTDQLRYLNLGLARKHEQEVEDTPWRVRFFKPSGIFSSGPEAPVYVGDELAGCIHKLSHNGRTERIAQFAEPIVFLGGDSKRLAAATPSELLQIDLSRDRRETLYSAGQSNRILYARPGFDETIWLALMTNREVILIQVSSDGRMFERRALPMLLEDFSITRQGGLWGLDTENRQILALNETASNQAGQDTIKLPDWILGKPLRLFHSPGGDFLVSSGGSWSLAKLDGTTGNWSSPPIPFPTAQEVFFPDGSDTALVAAGRYHLGLEAPFASDSQGDIAFVSL